MVVVVLFRWLGSLGLHAENSFKRFAYNRFMQVLVKKLRAREYPKPDMTSCVPVVCLPTYIYIYIYIDIYIYIYTHVYTLNFCALVL